MLDEISKQGVSIIIGARNEFKTLSITISDLINDCESSGITKYEIILMDNGSDDETSKFYAWKPASKVGRWLYEYSPRGMVSTGRLRIFYDPVLSNVGTRNKGALHARYDNLIFADAHITVKYGTILSTLTALNTYGGIIHAPVSWMGSDPSDPSPSYQYSYKVGEKIWGCVDEDTEILTKDGWKKWNEASVKDSYVTVNIQTNQLELQQATDFTVKDFDGEMVRIENKDTDMLLTPDHRTLVENAGSLSIKLAKDIKNDRIPFKTKGYKENSNFCSLSAVLGWIFTDANYDREKGRTKNRVRIIQKKEANCKIIESDLERACIPYTKVVRKDGVTVFNLASVFSKYIIQRYPNRYFNVRDLWEMSSADLLSLWDRMMKADGYNNEVFYKTDKNKADLFQILTVLVGKGTCIKYKSPDYFRGNRFGNKGIYNVRSKNRRASKNAKGKYEKYVGKVWCPTVPNGTIIVRRNGKVTPTGQTWNRIKIADTPFYIPLSGHCWLAVKRDEFISKRGYPYAQRVYGGGEPYLDTKWWMTGSTSMCDPGSLVYHLSAGRGYNWHNEDLIHNMFLVSYILGGKKWSDRILITYMNKPGVNADLLKYMQAEAEAEGEADKVWLDEHKIMTFEEMLRLDWINDCDQCTKRGYPEPHPMRPWDTKNEQLYGHHHSYVQEFALRKDGDNVFIGNTQITNPEALKIASLYV